MKTVRYQLRKKLSDTSTTDVYQAIDTNTKQPVVVKVLKAMDLIGDIARKRIEREFRAARSVQSPHVIKYQKLVKKTDFTAIVTEACEGMSLRSHLALHGALSPDTAISYGLQIADGLSACHRAGVIHRNIKPEIIYISDNEHIKITDFVFATIENATALTITGLMFGSPEYAAPETLQKNSRDLRVDIYSFGIILWEMLAGMSPFEGKNISQIIRARSAGNIPPPSALNPEVPPWLDELVSYTIAVDPEDRPSSFSEVIYCLQNRKRPKSLSQGKKGRCLFCGHNLLSKLPFCHFCGKRLEDEDSSEDLFALVISKSGDHEAMASFFEETFHERPKKDLKKALRKPPISVIEGISEGEGKWLMKKLHEMGCAVHIHYLPRWYFQLSSIVLFLSLFALLGFYDLISFSKGDFSYWWAPTFKMEIFAVKVILLVLMLMILCLAIRKHYAAAYRIPREWVKGLRPRKGILESRLGRIAPVAVFLVSISIMAVIMFFLYIILNMVSYTIPLILSDLFFSPPAFIIHIIEDPIFDEPYESKIPWEILMSYVQELYLKITLMLPILAIAQLFVKKIFRDPLFVPSSRENASDLSLDIRSEYSFLERIRLILSDVSMEEFRYLSAEAVGYYVQFIHLSGSSFFKNSEVVYEYKEKINSVMERFLYFGEIIGQLLKKVSPEEQEKAREDLIAIHDNIGQDDTNRSDTLRKKFRIAQDKVISAEAAWDEISRIINALRVAVGGMHTAILQLTRAEAEGRLEHEEIAYGLNVLSEEIKAVVFTNA